MIHSQSIDSVDKFLKFNENKNIVVVQGLGFVGAVMSMVVANSNSDEYAVIGIELPERENITKALNNGEFPIKSSDPKVFEFYQNAREKQNFYATTDLEVYSKADIVIVDINLDVKKSSNKLKDLQSYNVDLSGFEKAIRSVASRCKPDLLLLVETTVPPGTCEKIIKPIFQEEFKKRGLSTDYKIGHSYERVMPGPGYVDSIKNFYRVYAGVDQNSADATEKFLKSIISTDKFPLTRLKNTNATEMSKVLENSFRAMNIAFIQEWTEFAENAGVDLFEVVNAIRMRPTHKNIMRPGLGVGGYCLTKDPLLASWASKELFNSSPLSQSEQAVKINDKMPLHTFKVLSNELTGHINEKNILILGISYLQNVGDERFTPVELLYDQLKAEGANIILHDPYFNYWKDKEVDVHDGIIPDGKYDAVILGTPHDFYIKEKNLENLLSNIKNTLIIDPHGAIPADLINKLNNHKIKIIGRGDV